MASEPKVVELSDTFLTVALIQMFRDDCLLGTATGFFYRKDNDIFLVTNRHVVINEENSFYPNKLVLRCRKKDNLAEIVSVTLPLLNPTGEKIWLDFGAKIDIAAIELDEDVVNKLMIKTFSKDQFPPEDIQLIPGEDLVILCYPHGFYDEVHNLPIVRKASLASAYGVPFRGKPYFLVDSMLHPGTSGSPVLTKSSPVLRKKNQILIGKPETFILGIHSATQVGLNLDYVWYIKLVEKLVSGEGPEIF